MTETPLRETFLNVSPREIAGPRSSDRFAYQRDWALCQLLKLHSDTSDYLIVFDLHDDVLIFDSEANPTLISFYQVKTRGAGKPWTRTDLVRRPPGKEGPKMSILGKLYSNKLSFPANTRELTFVTNAPVTLTLDDGTKSTSRRIFRAVELSADERTKLANSLNTECGQCAEADIDTYLGFEVSDLSLEDHAVHARGKLAEFLEQMQPDGHRTVKVSVVHKTLSDEITRRNNASRESVVTFSDLAKLKGFGRSGFQALLAEAGLFENLLDTWKQLEHRLNTELVPYGRVMALKRHWTAIEAQRLDFENSALRRLMQRVRELLMALTGQEPERLTDLLETVLARVRQDGDVSIGFHDDDIRVVTMMRSYEAGELSATGSGATEANS